MVERAQQQQEVPCKILGLVVVGVDLMLLETMVYLALVLTAS
jgi:hypothetical protein